MNAKPLLNYKGIVYDPSYPYGDRVSFFERSRGIESSMGIDPYKGCEELIKEYIPPSSNLTFLYESYHNNPKDFHLSPHWMDSILNEVEKFFEEVESAKITLSCSYLPPVEEPDFMGITRELVRGFF